jgi:ketosteroid isomerase-like protein
MPGAAGTPRGRVWHASPVSSANVDVVKLALEAFNGGDADAFADLTTPDLEWATGLGAVEGEIFRGREGVETYFDRLSSAWDGFRFLAHEFRDLDDVVLVLGRLEGRGRAGGVPVDSPVGAVWNLRGGKIWRLRAYLDHDKAREVAGLARSG